MKGHLEGNPNFGKIWLFSSNSFLQIGPATFTKESSSDERMVIEPHPDRERTRRRGCRREVMREKGEGTDSRNSGLGLDREISQEEDTEQQHKGEARVLPQQKSRERVRRVKVTKRKEDPEAVQEPRWSPPSPPKDTQQKKPKKRLRSERLRNWKKLWTRPYEARRRWPKSSVCIGSDNPVNQLRGSFGSNGEKRIWIEMSIATSVANGPQKPTYRARIISRQ